MKDAIVVVVISAVWFVFLFGVFELMWHAARRRKADANEKLTAQPYVYGRTVSVELPKPTTILDGEPAWIVNGLVTTAGATGITTWGPMFKGIHGTRHEATITQEQMFAYIAALDYVTQVHPKATESA